MKIITVSSGTYLVPMLWLKNIVKNSWKLYKHLSCRLWHNAFKDELWGGRGSERELVLRHSGREVLRGRVIIIVVVVVGVGSSFFRNGTVNVVGIWHDARRRKRRVVMRCKSFWDLESRGTPWTWEKLHRYTRTFRQRGLNKLRPATVNGALWFHVWGWNTIVFLGSVEMFEEWWQHESVYIVTLCF